MAKSGTNFGSSILRAAATTAMLLALAWVAGVTSSLAHAASLAAANSVTIDNIVVSYPAGWSTLQSGRITAIVNAPVEKAKSLGNKFVFTPQVNVSIEQRLDEADALKELEEIAAGAGALGSRLTIDGSPAVQWRTEAAWPQPGNKPQSAPLRALTINTAIAAGSQLIRLYGSLPLDAPSATADAMAKIESSVTFLSKRNAPQASPRSDAASDSQVGRSTAAVKADDGEDETDVVPPISQGTDSAGTPSAVGVANRILQGTAASEPEVAVSANGRNVVIAQQFVWTWSNNGGQTFTFGGSFPNSTGGDSSLAVGAATAENGMVRNAPATQTPSMMVRMGASSSVP